MKQTKPKKWEVEEFLVYRTSWKFFNRKIEKDWQDEGGATIATSAYNALRVQLEILKELQFLNNQSLPPPKKPNHPTP